MKKRRKKYRRLIFIRVILTLICLYSAVRLVEFAINSISTKQTNVQLQAVYDSDDIVMEATQVPVAPAITQEPMLLETYQYISDTVLPQAKQMLSRNPDTVAWLKIPGGIVDLPVVYRDNKYYMDHDFYGKKSNSGTLFLDEKHPFLQDTQYLVVHGHDMYDGSMFGMLSHYRKRGYMDQHPTVYLNTLYRQEEYEVIGVLFVPSDVKSAGYVPYTGIRKFQSTDQFYGFAKIIQENALYWKDGAEMLPSDALLALSTCFDDNRIVVMCRRISPQ